MKFKGIFLRRKVVGCFEIDLVLEEEKKRKLLKYNFIYIREVKIYNDIILVEGFSWIKVILSFYRFLFF